MSPMLLVTGPGNLVFLPPVTGETFMASRPFARTVAVLGVVLVAGGIFQPANAALVYTDCLDMLDPSWLAQNVMPPRQTSGGVTTIQDCLRGGSLGDPAARPPAGEYLD